MEDLTGKSPEHVTNPRTREAVEIELGRILSSQTFRAAQRPSNFLRYAVSKTLEGHGGSMKEYSIAVEVFGRKDTFDPRLDPVVRVEATKLRSRLATYYSVEGRHDPIRIELPKRGYMPVFVDADLTQELEAAEVVQPSSEGRRPATESFFANRRKVFTLGFVLLIVAGLSAYTVNSFQDRKRVPSDSRSIAVLPFANLDDNKEDEYFSDGLTDELIASLGRVPSLRVVARASVFQFKGKTYDIREIGNKLNVRRVLEGSVRKFGTRLRITVHLDDAANGYRIWSKIYERESKDALTVQREIAVALVNLLGVEFMGKDWESRSRRLSSVEVVNPEAYQDYLKGLFFWNKNTAASIRTAIDYFEDALALDPNYAPIYTGLGRCYTALPVFTRTSSGEVIPKIRQVALKALSLEPDFGEAHLQLGEAAFLEYDWPAAERELKLALQLSPGDAVVHRWYSYYLSRMGRLDEELVETIAAQRIDPVSPYMAEGVGHSYLDLRRYNEAIEQYRRALALEPNFLMAIRGLGMAYLYQGQKETGLRELARAMTIDKEDSAGTGEIGYAYGICGRRAEAQAILTKLLDESRHGSSHPLYIAQVYVGLGDRDDAFAWLTKAVEQHEISLGLKSDAMFDPLRSDPRFAALLRRMKLSP